ncbi:MAG: hypothetical protein AAB443_03555 [Patescibacteria group bacterium]
MQSSIEEKKVKIIPGILVSDLETIKKRIAMVDSYAYKIQIDVEDGSFTQNTTYTNIKEIENVVSKTPLELHLMVQNPRRFLPTKLIPVNKVLVHVEASLFERDVLEEIRDRGFETGLAVNPETMLYEIEPFLEICGCVQFMTIHPGFSGDKLLPKVLEKIKEFSLMYPDIPIEVDGGIHKENILEVVKSGATLLEVNSAVFGNDRNPLENIKELELLCKNL